MNVCTICLLLTGLLLAPATLWARVIRPASLSLVTGPVRLAVSDTFLITGTSGSIRQACSHPATATIDSCPLPAVLFPLGSAEPEPNQTEQMFTGLRHCQVSLTTPLAVTGHTCSLGTEATNLRLSRLRAEQVATLLRDRGYTVATVSGKGATDPVSTNPTKRHLNRRVTLARVDQSPARPAVPNNHDGA
jgi:hypothetical protein